MRALRFTDVHRGAECLVATCAIDDLRFHATVWYEDVDLHALARLHGDDAIERLAVHVALFQLNTVASLRPDVIELGPYARHLSPELIDVWTEVFRRVWAQWRYEHDLPDYAPRFADAPSPAAPPLSVAAGPTELLAFSGGGKDSLVVAKLLERAHLPFATLGYAHSIYGNAERQHALLDRLGAATARTRAERMWVIDDVLDAPVSRLRGLPSFHAAETPASIFAALPLALARGYTGLVVGHEASANAANLTWRGEDVNHQWGKGWEAEQLLDRYVSTHLLSNVRYFSALAPVHDEVILELLARDAHLAPLTHSCNLAKPWCGACAKCAYVWLQFAAHLPADVVHATFGANLGESPANDRHFRELLGLAEHSPFECTGSIPEARLALSLARARGALGPRLLALAAGIDAPDPAPFLELHPHGMPAHVAAAIVPQLAAAAATAADRLGVPRT